MTESLCLVAISPLRQRLLDDMAVRRFSRETQRNYLRDVGRFATFLGRSPHTATAEDVRQFQIAQNAAGLPTPTLNAIVSALRFFFTQTLDRPDLARKLVRVAVSRAGHHEAHQHTAAPSRGCRGGAGRCDHQTCGASYPAAQLCHAPA